MMIKFMFSADGDIFHMLFIIRFIAAPPCLYKRAVTCVIAFPLKFFVLANSRLAFASIFAKYRMCFDNKLALLDQFLSWEDKH